MRKNILLSMSFLAIIFLCSFHAGQITTGPHVDLQRDGVGCPFPVTFHYVDDNGCTIDGNLSVDCYGIVTGTITLGGGPYCPHGVGHMWSVRPPGEPDGDLIYGVTYGLYTIDVNLDGGNDFCTATGMTFSGADAVQDEVTILNKHSKAILDQFKKDMGC